MGLFCVKQECPLGKSFVPKTLYAAYIILSDRVTWAKNDVNFQKVKRSKKGKVLSNQEASVFVSFAGMRTDVTVNEEVLRRIFGSFGQISEVAIRLSLIDKLTFVRKGYAFIRYEVSSDGVMSAVNAAKVMHNTVRDDVHFHVEISRILASNLQSLTSRNSNSSKFDNRRSDSSINNFPVSRSYGSGPLQHDPFGSNNDFPFHEQSFDHEEYSHFPKDFAPFESPTEYPQSVFRDAKVPMMDHSFYNHPSSSSSHNPPNLSNYPALGHSSSHQPYHRPQNHFAGMNGVRMNDRMNDHHFDGIPPSSSMNSFASSTSSISSSFSSTFSY